MSAAAICLALSPAAAQAASTITGDQDTNVPLEITPAADPLTLERDDYSDGSVAFIQQMPVTKTVRRVTLGDLGVGAGCTSGISLQLFVREHTTGDVDSASQITYSPQYQALPGTPGKVGWDIPATTLRKGRGYSFQLAYPQGCRYYKHVSWAHDDPPVNAGPASCARGPRLSPYGSQIMRRMYHVEALADATGACVSLPPSNPAFFDASMPTGWLVTNGSYVMSATNWTQEPAIDSVCGTGLQAAGARVVRWRASPGRPAGYYDYVCMWSPSQFAPPGELRPTGWFYGSPWLQARNGAPRDSYLKLDTLDYNALLERYVPQLRYHYAESYRADSAETMALVGVPPEGQDESWANNLERENGAVLATSDPLLPYPALTLSALPSAAGANVYAWGDSALDSDRIDARNGTYEQDAALMHQNPSLANRVYARATQGADGKLWLQYWLFYYYNRGLFGVGDHEADWEMIQIGLKSDLTPDVATYAQHSGAQICSWDRVPKYAGPAGTGPVVFVGIGTHASEFYAPDPTSYFPEYGSERVRPVIDRQIGNVVPTWATWRGRWGGSDATIRSPGRQGSKWDDPTGFNSAADGCPTQASGAVTACARERVKPPRARARALPAPRLTAQRSSKRVVVRYRYSRRAWKRLPRRAGVVLSVRGSKQGSLPRNVMFRLRHRAGQRRLGLPLSPGPYVVQGQTLTRSGAQSRPTTIHLK